MLDSINAAGKNDADQHAPMHILVHDNSHFLLV